MTVERDWFGFGFGFTTPFGWLVYLLWFWFYDSQVKTALFTSLIDLMSMGKSFQSIGAMTEKALKPYVFKL